MPEVGLGFPRQCRELYNGNGEGLSNMVPLSQCGLQSESRRDERKDRAGKVAK